MGYTKNATDIVYTFIKEKIAKNEWRPGERIYTEAKLSEELGVSRVAVRQAISRLELVSVLYSVQGSGTYVRDPRMLDDMDLGLDCIEYEDVISILEYRKYYECGNIALFIKFADENDIAELENCYNRMKNCNGDMQEFYTADYEFHEVLAKGTKKEFVYRITKSISKALIRHHEKVNLGVGPDIGLEYHKYILKYVKERDVELATLYMRKHMEETIQRMGKNRKKQQ